MDNIGLYITKISNKINNSDKSVPVNVLYIKEITNPKYQLTELIINQLCYPISYKAKVNLIKLLSSLLKYSPHQMTPQLEKSTKLAEFLFNSIKTQGPTGEGEEAFKLFINSFTIPIYNQYLTEDFIKLLFESLMVYGDAEIITKQIYILIDINSVYQSIHSNLFLKIYHDYPNLRQIQELLLEMLNNEKSKNSIYNMVTCLINMFDKENKCILYSNDIQVIIDIILNNLQSTYDDMIKQCMLELLQRITSFEDYFREMYRIEDLTEIIEDYTTNSDQSKTITLLSQNVLSNIAGFLQLKIKESELRNALLQ